jgi:pimeloyl-ACP methyl ester carboxylesterase
MVSAANDHLTPASAVQKTAAFLGPGVELREFPGLGHWVVDGPGWESIAAFIADWLEAHGGA